MHFTVNVDYTITFITQYTRQEVQNAERGMLREMDSLDVRDELDRITQDYCSFEPTQDFEPTQGNFNWPLIDAVVTKCAGRGKKTAFAIEPAKKGMQATPLWLFTQLGCGFETTTGAGPLIKVPVWSDPIYIDRMRELATQLAGRYDGHDNIAFIDGRSYGNWGEWHVHGLKGISAADKTTLARVPDSGPDYQCQVGVDHGFGMRRDSSNWQWSGAKYAYDHEIAVSEWGTEYPGPTIGPAYGLGVTSSSIASTVAGYMAQSHYSYDNLNQFDPTKVNQFINEQWSLIQEWGNKMGYWFKLKTSTIPTDLGKYAHGVANHIAFSVYNDGVAPIYVNKKQSVVKVALLDASYNVLEITPITIASNLQPFYWKDGTTTTVTGTYTFTSAHFSAQYLALGVFTKQGLTNPDVKLGNMERCFTSNWVILNPDVGAPKPNTRC